MPVVHPADVWRASGRYDVIGPELGRFKDRNGRDMVLAMTHEEVVGLLLADIVKSYRQLPMQVYHFQTKWRDEPRSRGGLIRVREFVMKDAYSCDRDEAGLDASYWAQYGAYVRIFERLGLDAIPVRSDVGMMGGSLAHEFMVLNPAGEDVLVLCEACGYAANRQVAIVPRPEPAGRGRAPARGGRHARHDDDRDARGVPRRSTPARTAKAAFFVDRRRAAADRHRARRPRGQRDQAGQRDERDRRHPAGDGRGDQGRGDGAGLRLADRRPRDTSSSSTTSSPARRTWSPARTARATTCATSTSGATTRPTWSPTSPTPRRAIPVPTCGQPVILRNGIEVGNIFKLGTKYTDAFGATYLGEDGVAPPDRHGLVRDRRRPEHRRASSRPTTTTRASSGRPRSRPTRPTSCRSAPPRSRASSRSPSGSTTWRPLPARATRSCGTTATSRPGSSSPTPSCSACPGS